MSPVHSPWAVLMRCRWPVTIPAPRYTSGVPCLVVFERSDKRHFVVLPLAADEVGVRLRTNPDGFERFDDQDGKAVWINVRNVLYVEDE